MNANEQIPAADVLTAESIPEAVPSAAAQQNTRFQFLKQDHAFAWLLLPLGFLFSRYVLFKADGFLTTGFFLLLFLMTEIYLRRSGCKPKLPHHILGILFCLFSTVFSITASALLHGLCFIFLSAVLIWRTHSAATGAGFVTRFMPFDLAESAFREPSRHFGAAPQAMSDSLKHSETAGTVKTVLIGLIVTVPLTIIVAVLLSEADEGIQKMLLRFSDLLTDNVMALIMQILIGIPAAFWLFALLYSAVQRKKRPNPMTSETFYEELLSRARKLPNAGVYAGVTPICLLYLAYVISQTNYFLSAFAGKLPSDMIYSEYARRGFFELCAIAVINLIVILVLTGCAKKGGSTRPKLLTGYAVVLCLFTLFIIATALAKMALYIEAYGLTALRLYTAWFMVLLAVVFLVLLVRQFAKKLPTAAILTVSFTVLFGLLCFARPEARIAEYNIARYENGTLPELDVRMLCELSEDAYTVMAKHPDALKRAEKWNYFVMKAQSRTDFYSIQNDRSWNIPAQILIQQMQTDIRSGVIGS
ncbi:MAG: DUF4173 domain-containing protein [Oscillospiraceae bacterium]|nr:DUF4173 domain-containing protein [Oscillospiraceae bacterium]